MLARRRACCSPTRARSPTGCSTPADPKREPRSFTITLARADGTEARQGGRLVRARDARADVRLLPRHRAAAQGVAGPGAQAPWADAKDDVPDQPSPEPPRFEDVGRQGDRRSRRPAGKHRGRVAKDSRRGRQAIARKQADHAISRHGTANPDPGDAGSPPPIVHPGPEHHSAQGRDVLDGPAVKRAATSTSRASTCGYPDDDNLVRISYPQGNAWQPTRQIRAGRAR